MEERKDLIITLDGGLVSGAVWSDGSKAPAIEVHDYDVAGLDPDLIETDRYGGEFYRYGL